MGMQMVRSNRDIWIKWHNNAWIRFLSAKNCDLKYIRYRTHTIVQL